MSDIFNDRQEAKSHVQDFTLWPKIWNSFKLNITLTWDERTFESSEANNIPEEPGVYTFVIKPEIASHPACAYLVYTGKAKDLKRRFKQYLEVQNQKRRHSPKIEQGLMQYKGYLFFIYSLLKKKSITKVEQVLIDGFIPPWNDKKTISSEVGNIVRAF